MTATKQPGLIEAQAVIIGAGPIGLFQAFQLGLLEISAHIIDALPYVGGQCVELYADKPIYDVPGIPLCTGRELIANLSRQLEPFKPSLHLGELVTGLEPQSDGRLLLETSRGKRFLTQTLFIAAGVGAFQARMPGVEGLEAFAGTQVHTALPGDTQWASQKVLILGDTESALQAAIDLANSESPPQSVTLMHRRNVFTAEPATQEKFRALVAAGSIHFVAGQLNAVDIEGDHLSGAVILNAEGVQETLATDQVLVLMGLSPKLGPIAHWGLDMERRQLKVNTENFATALPGVFAVGDVNTYPGKKKLILCGFHETVLAAFGAAPLVLNGKTPLLQYTTTSTKLHALLGVDSLPAGQKSEKVTL